MIPKIVNYFLLLLGLYVITSNIFNTKNNILARKNVRREAIHQWIIVTRKKLSFPQRNSAIQEANIPIKSSK